MRTYSAYFSTVSTVHPPSATYLGDSWPVNWRNTFGNRVGECRIRAKLISVSSPSLCMNATHLNGSIAGQGANVGSVRINFISNTAQYSAGVVLGSVKPLLDLSYPYGGATPYNYLELDTSATNGLSVVIPNYMDQSQHLTVSFYDATEQPMINVPDYQLWLYSDIDDDIPVQPNVEKCPVSYF